MAVMQLWLCTVAERCGCALCTVHCALWLWLYTVAEHVAVAVHKDSDAAGEPCVIARIGWQLLA